MQFKEFSNLVKDKFTELTKQDKLFVSSLSGNNLWDIYISSFKPEDNPIFRDPNSSSHNDNLDKSFIRRYGNIVAINENYEIITMWDIDLPKDNEYYLSTQAMSKALRIASINNIFLETFDELNSLPYEKCTKNQSIFRLGIETNHKIYTEEEANKFGVVKAKISYQFNHFNCDLPTKFVDKSGKSQASIQSDYKAAKDVFLRGMQEIPLYILNLVKDLINQGSLLDGTTHLYKIDTFIPLQKEFLNQKSINLDNWAWVKSYELPIAKFRNELIGTLCVDLAEGMELNTACQTWNKRVDPANYMKAKAPITANQIKQAQEFVQENGYEESFNRRFATIDDINVEEILHSNVGDGKIKTASIFDKINPAVSARHKKAEFDKLEEVSIDKFMKDILPTATSIEAFVENKMEGNLVGKSMIKEAVKTAGGKVDGILRASMIWNDNEKRSDKSDLDLWCNQPMWGFKFNKLDVK